MRRAIKLAVIAPVAALALLTGCNSNNSSTGTGGNTGTATTEATTEGSTGGGEVTPETITAASKKSLSETLHMTADIQAAGQGIKLEGDVNPSSNEMSMKMTGALPMEMIISPSDVYIKSSMFAAMGAGDKWLHVDVNKLSPNSNLRQSMDVRSNLGALAGVTEIKETSPGNYEGNVDLEKAASASDSPSVKQSMETLVKQAGANAKQVPFTAKTDSEGRLTEFTYTIKTTQAGDIKTVTTMSDFGKTVTITKPPAAQVQEAPQELYNNL